MFFLFKKNCWFCNTDSRVSIFNRNSWICPKCEQYNGFNEDGDYNKEIPEMYKNTKLINKFQLNNKTKLKNNQIKTILCDKCNQNQLFKIEKLSNYQPRSEATYDFEIELYKEYLEKIYELCSKCESKVKFEITKQDGILKQYLYKLGNFDFLFERNRYFNMNKSDLKTNKKKSTSTVSYWNLIFYIIIFILSTLTILYNDYNHIDDLNEQILNISELDHLIERFNYKFRSKIIENFSIKTRYLIENSLNKTLNLMNQNELKELKFSNYLNRLIPFNLVIVYILSSLFVFINSKSNLANNYLKSIFIVWSMNLILILFNYKLFMSYLLFKSTNTIKINLNFILLIIPLIQLIVLRQIFLIINKSMFVKKKEKNLTQTISSDLFKNQVQYHINDDIYQFIKPKSEIIKPARFKPMNNKYSDSLFQFKTNRYVPQSEYYSNDLKSDSSNEDSSSIVSGLTNLYLDRTNLFEQKSQTNLNYQSPKSDASNYYSFYQSVAYKPKMVADTMKLTNRTESMDMYEKISNYLTVIIAVNLALMSVFVYMFLLV